jgi:uncharacterized protein YpmS
LKVDGVVVADDLTFVDEYVTANTEIVFDKTRSGNKSFQLYGTITGDVNETVAFEIEETDDMYAVGNKNGYNVSVTDLSSNDKLTSDTNGSDSKFGLDIEGANINVSFTKSSEDKVGLDVDDFSFGTLSLEALGGDYELKSYTIKLTKTANSSENNTPDKVKLGGRENDNTVIVTST